MNAEIHGMKRRALHLRRIAKVAREDNQTGTAAALDQRAAELERKAADAERVALVRNRR